MKFLPGPALLLSLGLFACSRLQEGQLPPPSPQPAHLLTMAAAGGLCPYGVCRTDLSLETDGTYVLQDGDAVPREGAADQARLVQLAEYINKADFNEIKSHPFPDLCPTAYDGTEMTYTFHTSHGTEVVASCGFAIDHGQPLFQLADALWHEILPDG